MLFNFRKYIILLIVFNLGACSSFKEVRFAVMGDTPYFESDTELENVLIALNQMASKGMPFVVHVGDIIRGGTNCSESLFKLRANIFSKSPIPFIITIGDNEFNDCKQPLLAQERFRQVILGNPEVNQSVHGLDDSSHPVVLNRQEALIENASWAIDGVKFILLTLPDMPGNFPLSKSDADHIINANIQFLRDKFNQARSKRHDAVVLIMHSNPATCGLESCYTFLEILKKEVSDFSKPVLLINGSNHDAVFNELNYFGITNLSHLRPGNEPESEWPEIIFSTENNKFNIKWHRQEN